MIKSSDFIEFVADEMPENSNPIDPLILYKAFKQSRVKLPIYLRPFGGGNCASIAVIKASMEKYGFKVFKSVVVDKTNKRFLVDLRDEDERVYSISYWAFEYASGTTGFDLHTEDETSKKILLFAMFCFSVMAEVKRTEYRRFAYYKRAVTDLNRGDAAANIYSYLGLNAREIDFNDPELMRKTSAMVVWNSPHAVYSSKGYYDEFFDDYEDYEPLTILPEAHKSGNVPSPIIGAFQIVD